MEHLCSYQYFCILFANQQLYIGSMFYAENNKEIWVNK